MKTLVMIIGASATGKSTVTRRLAGADAEEDEVELNVTEKGNRRRVKSPYVLGAKIAVAGNLKNTSDKISAMDALYQTIDHCWKHRDIVIADPYRCTHKQVRWLEQHPLRPAVLFVYIDLPLEKNLARLRGRRAGNGKVEQKLPTKTFITLLGARERALSVWNYAQDNYKRQPVRYLELPVGLEPEESSQLVKNELAELEKAAVEFQNRPEAPVLRIAQHAADSIFRTQSLNRNDVHWENHLLDLTPVEPFGGIWLKREDRFAPLGYGNINGSKLRQLIWLFSQNCKAGVTSGAVTGSPQLPMVAACANHWGIPCIQFTGGNGEMVSAGEAFGATTELVNPGYAATLNAKAKKEAERRGWFHVETNITVEHKINPPERVEAFHRVGSEQCQNIPDHIETLLIPAGSCNSLTSILYGLARFKPKSLKTIHLFRIMKNADKHRQWTSDRLGTIRRVTADPLPLPYKFIEHNLVEGKKPYTSYNELRPYRHKGLEFHPRYEGKCLNYMKENLGTFRPLLNEKTMFWIIGSMPTCAPVTKHRAATAN